jgi:gentisate 1,2-dioxygenase
MDARAMEAPVRLHEYSSAANPVLPGVPAVAVGPEVHHAGPSRVIPVDNSAALGATPWPATSPNLLASFVRIVAGEALETHAPRATSQAFYVIRGAGASEGGAETPRFSWGEGDLWVLPATAGPVRHAADAAAGDASLYWIHDEPLLRYLGAAPAERRFAPTLYRRERLLAEVERIRHEPGVEHRNRMGVLLSNDATDGETKTLSHVLWALLNQLPARTAQPPHRHNSVALDLAVSASPGVYTLMGPELGPDGWVKDPLRMDWVPGAMFVTPPGECGDEAGELACPHRRRTSPSTRAPACNPSTPLPPSRRVVA